MMSGLIHHYDLPWCTIGNITILYHTSISVTTNVTYDERSVFGSHGAYAVWSGTAPRNYSLSANLVGARYLEVQFNIAQVVSAYNWTQESPPQCKGLHGPLGVASLFSTSVRIESFDASIPEATHVEYGSPIQIDFSLSLKECKPI